MALPTRLHLAVIVALSFTSGLAFPNEYSRQQVRISEWADETKFEEVRWKRPDVPEVLQDDPEEEETRPDMEKWGYVDVRPGVHMLYWLYYSTHPDGYRQRPWILWLQGGPALSGTALGNFAEIGPLDHRLRPRSYSWVEAASVVFVDNPVGTGFSYAEDEDKVARGIEAISADLLAFMQTFLQENVQFKTRPLYIFGQSYGGKMTSHFAYTLSKAINREEIEVDLKGIGLGNSFVSPFHFLGSMGDFLHQMSMIDNYAHKRVLAQVGVFKSSLGEGRPYEEVEKNFYEVWSIIGSNNGGGYYNFYNVLDLKKGDDTRRKRGIPPVPVETGGRLFFDSIYDLDLKPLMDGYVRRKLGIIPENVTWQGQEMAVYMAQAETDFYDDTIYTVDWLLKNTDVEVAIYEGQLDVACTPSGAEDWVDTLTWPALGLYQRANRTAILNPVSHQLEMFVKAHGQLKFYWVVNSGHAVPADRPEIGFRLLNRILDGVDV